MGVGGVVKFKDILPYLLPFFTQQYLVQNNDNFIMRTQLEGLYLHMKVSLPVTPSL